MTAADWAALIVSVLTITSGFAMMVKWLVKHYLSELKPNGGASMMDKVNRLENRVYEIFRLLVDK
jgi:hypothetical protein